MNLFTRLRYSKEFDLNKVDNINIVDENKRNLLQVAIAKRPDLVEALISMGIDVDHQDNDGNTALHYALEHANFRAALKIMDQNCNVNIANKYGNAALWPAVLKYKPGNRIVSTLVAMGADRNHKNKVGKSPIDLAKQILVSELHAELGI